MVLVHGVGLRGEVWEPQVADFASDHQVIVYDTLGHGSSDLPPPAASLQDYVAQLEGVLDALDIGAAVVVGHSMGAIIATAFAIEHPARVKALAALCPVYDRDAASREAAQARARTLAECGPAQSVEPTLRRWFAEEAAERDEARTLRGWLTSADPVGYARAYAVFVIADRAIVGRLGGLRAPALFLAAADDPNSTPQMARRMAAEAPRGRAVVLPEARHMVPFLSPARVNAEIRAFIEEQSP